MAEFDEDRLQRIERKVDTTLSEVRNILSYDGPIGDMMQKLAIVDQRVRSAHHRIDEHEVHIDKIRGTMWSLIWKIVAIGAAGGSTVYAAEAIVRKLSGG